MAVLTTEYLDKVLGKMFTLFKEHFDQKFDEIDQRFDESDKKFVLLNERMDLLEAKINDLDQKVDFHFIFLKTELADIKQDLEAYAKRDKDDSDAFKKDVIKLQKRVSTLEDQVKKLKTNQKQSAKI